MGTADLTRAPGITAREKVLLEYVKVLTLEPAQVRDHHVARLRKVGYTDDQIFEATLTTAQFAFYNRMAEGFGLGFVGPWRPPTASPTSKLPTSKLPKP